MIMSVECKVTITLHGLFVFPGPPVPVPATEAAVHVSTRPLDLEKSVSGGGNW